MRSRICPRIPLASVAIVLTTLASSVAAQHARYEVGLRVRAFEREFAKCMADVEVRRRVLPKLDDAVKGFFRGNLGGVARSMDVAHHVVTSPDAAATTDVRFVASLECRPSTRCVDTADEDGGLELRIQPMYRAGRMPDDLRLRWRLVPSNSKPNSDDDRALAASEESGVPIASTPALLKLPCESLPEGDYRLEVEWRVAGERVRSRKMTLSVVRKAKERLEALRAFCREHPPTSMEAATLHDHVRVLRVVILRRSHETDIAAARMIREAEALRAWLATPVQERAKWWTRERRGSMRVAFPAETRRGRKGVVPARLFVPPLPQGQEREQRRPLVIALAGAGASANMWFEAYGAGSIVDLCRKRGWILVARASAGFDPVTHVSEMMREIEKRWSVDKNRVFVVGHSMGAMKACALVARTPAPFRAVVALGGGGRTGRGEAYRKIAFYIAPGAQDFLLAQARTLSRSLEKKEQPVVRYRVFEACEHLGIVQVALPDAFAWLDRLD